MNIKLTQFNPIGRKRSKFIVATALTSLLLACGGGNGGATLTVVGGTGTPAGNECERGISPMPQALTAAEVEKILAQGAQAADSIGAKATIAVVDRVGNVLGVYQMNGARPRLDLLSGIGNNKPDNVQGLDGLSDFLGSELGAMAKAITGAYLSSSGNAFSTRTASFIIQEHFPSKITQQPGGPLFGVQFSQLPCGDLVQRGTGIGVGPRRSPLGLAGDPGGFPLYKAGRVVGGIGVIADGVYGLDRDPQVPTADLDERIAQSALTGFTPPDCILADRISVAGLIVPYSNSRNSLASVNASSLTDPKVSSLGRLIRVPGYFDNPELKTLAGTAFGEPSSGIVPDPGGLGQFRSAFILTEGANGVNRFPITSAPASQSGGQGLNAAEVQEILSQAIGVANQSRAQIRKPSSSPVEVTVSVIDINGKVQGLARTPDAPVFGIDVSLQKARGAVFFSSTGAAASLTALPPVRYASNIPGTGPVFGPAMPFSNYLSEPVLGARDFFNNPNAFADGSAFSARAIGNIARPNFPDGIDGNQKGPLSKPIATWSPFNVGIQLDLVYNNLVGALLAPNDLSNNNCTQGVTQLKNGTQIFPGGFPIYRGTQLIGAVGVSGDGIDQDDMVGFLGLFRATQVMKTGFGHAPKSMRADTLAPLGRLLRYVQCPQAPFNTSNEDKVCEGI
jgi:uncharacterized protein GlcG (DUF336 family)